MRYSNDGKFINCEDCGKLVRVNPKDHQTVRCYECQHNQTQIIKRDWKRNYDKIKKVERTK